ncbi:uncharacterized protein MONBRDRAFT_10970 [Monosiga brevicollis MX1]|uniref:Uncharacterized protein n=1 Tax=Monosiga brevicollis TaxID=81824 RepID=A9V7T6_MONBE|nr:uncharacterized protein MONBRDRAFT_10970 [Monosiga brevicollis MX1]EDQ86433.1 predicted protein [Monosiga brevicollis MX1]|eukprot:XP_001748823.1 hypothetical protein [Monosiga brevicollis MX1]
MHGETAWQQLEAPGWPRPLLCRCSVAKAQAKGSSGSGGLVHEDTFRAYLSDGLRLWRYQLAVDEAQSTNRVHNAAIELETPRLLTALAQCLSPAHARRSSSPVKVHEDMRGCLVVETKIDLLLFGATSVTFEWRFICAEVHDQALTAQLLVHPYQRLACALWRYCEQQVATQMREGASGNSSADLPVTSSSNANKTGAPGQQAATHHPGAVTLEAYNANTLPSLAEGGPMLTSTPAHDVSATLEEPDELEGSSKDGSFPLLPGPSAAARPKEVASATISSDSTTRSAPTPVSAPPPVPAETAPAGGPPPKKKKKKKMIA